MNMFFRVREMFAAEIEGVVHLAGSILSLTEKEFSEREHQLEEVPEDVVADLGLTHPEDGGKVALKADGTPASAPPPSLPADPPVVAQWGSPATPLPPVDRPTLPAAGDPPPGAAQAE